jgi:hypothetical protein
MKNPIQSALTCRVNWLPFLGNVTTLLNNGRNLVFKTYKPQNKAHINVSISTEILVQTFLC